jgi:peptidoglycan/xylan/chitin deacetylase (PgdA/CDA1 family)
LKRTVLALIVGIPLALFLSLAVQGDSGAAEGASGDFRKEIEARFGGRSPREWGETVTGIKTRLDTNRRAIALTFDACGSGRGKGYDARLVDFLIRERLPATLFFAGPWIEAQREHFLQLAARPHFEIGNHGFEHRPCSVNGRSAYGLRGTGSPGEAAEEIEANGRRIEALTGRRPQCYRSGTAYCDEVCVEIAGTLGYTVVNYSVLGDAGATFSRKQVKRVLLAAPPRSIVLLHMNHPESGTADGVLDAVPELKRQGIEFVRLSDVPLK